MAGTKYLKQTAAKKRGETPVYSPNVFIIIAIGVYIFLSFFEEYFSETLGSGMQAILGGTTKYYMVLLAIVIIFTYKQLNIRYIHVALLCWLAYKLLSILWVWNGYNYIIETTLFTQITMVMLLIVITLVDYDEKKVDILISILCMTSFLMGILSIFFSEPYVESVNAHVSGRYVLTLFGMQKDPNNQAAFLASGIAIALYRILTERRKIILYTAVVAVNTYSVIRTASRGGLVTVCAVALVCLFLPWSAKRIPLIAKIILLALVAAVAVYIFLTYADADSIERIFDSSDYRNGSGRIDIWGNALILFKESPLIGSGWGSYFGYNHFDYALHNTFLQSLCETGVFGTVLLFTPAADAFITAVKRKNGLPIVILTAGLVPCLFLDAANKRFFWNALIFAVICAREKTLETDKEASGEKEKTQKLSLKERFKTKYSKKSTCKYIK